MDFEFSEKVRGMQARLTAFMEEHIYPNEARFAAEASATHAPANLPTLIAGDANIDERYEAQ